MPMADKRSMDYSPVTAQRLPILSLPARRLPMWHYPPHADYTLPVAPVPIRGVIQQADHPHSGQTIGCYGKPALGGKD